MKSSAKERAHSEYLLTVKVTATEMADFWQRAIAKIKPKIKIDGWRAGRAPADVIIKQVGRPAVEAETLDIALSDTYFMALQEHKLLPIANPKIDIKRQVVVDPDNKSDEIVLEYTAAISVVPDVTVPGLNKIRVTEPVVAAPTDEEVQKVVDYLRRQKALMKEVDRPAAKGDWVDVGYEGSVNGVKQAAMHNDHHPLILGEGNLIPGFEEHIIGLKKGEHKSFTITFPKDYHAADVAGKKALFAVTVHEVKEVILPEFDPIFTKDFGYAQPDEMLLAITKNLAREKADEAKNGVREQVLKEVEQRIKADIPPAMFEHEQERMIHDLRHKVEEQKLPWDKYLTQIKRTEDELKRDFRPQAEKNVRLGLGLGAIVKEQGIAVKDEASAVVAAIDWLVELATGKVKAKE